MAAPRRYKIAKGKNKMTENKLNIAISHIEMYTKRMEVLERDMAREARYIQEDLEKGKTYWIDAYAKKLQGYYTEHQHYKKMQEEMRDLLDFLTREEEAE
jgi:hypothetical protein